MIQSSKWWLQAAVVACCLAALSLAAACPAIAQEDGAFNLNPKGGNKLLPGGGPFGGNEEEVQATAEFHVIRGTRLGKLTVTLDIPAGYHIYSLTQPKGGPKKTVITLEPSDQARPAGDFVAERAPHVRDEPAFKMQVEEYEESIAFHAELEFADAVKYEELTLPVKVIGQVCSESCRDLKLDLTAKFAGYIDAPTPSFQPSGARVTLTGEATVVGSKVLLRVHATPVNTKNEHWHIYEYEPASDAKIGEGTPTIFVFTNKAGWKVSQPKADAAVISKVDPTTNARSRYYDGPVTLTFELTPPAGETPTSATLAGMVGLQTCTENRCLGQTVTEFQVALPTAEASQGQMLFSAGKISYVELNKQALAAAPAREPLDLSRLGLILVFAFVGGAILNLMPCVLPVIGLKVLSFARQGGQSHARVFGLNLSYSIGLISVFLILAGLAAFLNLGWGDQFQYIGFKVTMTAVVFVMALSFLGVWELPVPGFATSGKAGELQNQHGYAGAFFKGMFTTLLATPCSGPFLGAVFPFAIKQEPAIIFLIFGCIGLGMASPYLLIGMFPGMVKFLPKPGEWMETFERVMGFVLLGTVVYLFSTFGKEYQHYFIPTLALLMALWFGCWLIGQVPEYAGWGKRAMSWLAAGAVAGVVGYGAFVFSGHSYLKWEPYDEAKLAQHLREGRTVMIDFTADWCATCQVNKAIAIDTRRVAQLAEKNGVVAMLADKTNPSPHIDTKLEELNSDSIPLLAIYPGNNPNEPIVLRDLLLEGHVVSALEKAGPSKTKPAEIKTAMRP